MPTQQHYYCLEEKVSHLHKAHNMLSFELQCIKHAVIIIAVLQIPVVLMILLLMLGFF